MRKTNLSFPLFSPDDYRLTMAVLEINTKAYNEQLDEDLKALIEALEKANIKHYV